MKSGCGFNEAQTDNEKLWRSEWEQISKIAKELQEENDRLKILLKIAICPNCDGSGAIPVQTCARQYVTHDMAMDACCPEMEGSLYCDDEWEATQCQWCYEKDEILKTTEDKKIKEDDLPF
ncbi:MAG: hypothetical protein WC119_00265 [Synergistaceae bacterium]